MQTTYYPSTVDSILNLFNHEVTRYDLRRIDSLFSAVRDSECDELALGVVDTLEQRVARFSVPYCSERQAQALAYAINRR